MENRIGIPLKTTQRHVNSKLEEITTSISSEAKVRGMLMNLLDRRVLKNMDTSVYIVEKSLHARVSTRRRTRHTRSWQNTNLFIFESFALWWWWMQKWNDTQEGVKFPIKWNQSYEGEHRLPEKRSGIHHLGGRGVHNYCPRGSVFCKTEVTDCCSCVRKTYSNNLGEESHVDNNWFFCQLWKKHMQ